VKWKKEEQREFNKEREREREKKQNRSILIRVGGKEPF
jgi:spore coat polysaccharide biosynthesis predicted glycosyltransferase SpsG